MKHQEHIYICLRKSRTRNGKLLFCCKHCHYITVNKAIGYCNNLWTLEGYTLYDDKLHQLTISELAEDIRTS